MTITIERGKNTIKGRYKNLDLQNPYAVVFSARKGVRVSMFYDFAKVAKMSEKKLAGILNISTRTITNYKVKNKVLDAVTSEHLLKLIALFEKGENIFGNIDEFNYWLDKPFWNEDEAPLDWIITPGGVDLLIKELDKLAQGYPV